MSTTTSESRSESGLALALGGGGARAAYQVGVLEAIAGDVPAFRPSILTGVSAGAINTAHLANHVGSMIARTETLSDIWLAIDHGDIFEANGLSLARHATTAALRLAFGGKGGARFHGMVNTAPLRKTLCRALRTTDGRLTGVQQNLDDDTVRAVALTATEYATGQTVTFFRGREIEAWERPQRRAEPTDLTVDHVMASAALPLFFPPVKVGDAYYGDGGMRLVAPFAPAVHLGAGKILTVSTRYARSVQEARRPGFTGRPSPAQILGVLYNAIFLDMLDQDALQMERINRLLGHVPPSARGGLREVRLFVVRPSVDLGSIANEFEPRLPGVFRHLTRRLGTRRARSQDFLSTVMFQPDFIRALHALGRRDGRAQAGAIARFLEA